MTFDLGTWPLTAWTYEGSHISINQVWFKSDFQLFKWGYFHIFSLGTSTFQMRPFSHFQPILQLDLRWPLTLIYDHWPHQQMTVPMLHLWPDSGWNPSEHVEDRAKCQPFFSQQTTDNNRQKGTKWSVCVFPAKAGDTKIWFKSNKSDFLIFFF